LKSFNKNAIDKIIDIIVIQRVGVEVFEHMLSIAVKGEPNKLWPDREWLEEKIKFLTRIRDEFLRLKGVQINGLDEKQTRPVEDFG
jgi:hypothetical protein